MAQLNDIENYTSDDQQNNQQQDQSTDNVVKTIQPTKWAHLSTIKEQLNERNWAEWERWIIPVLRVLKVWPYVNGKIRRPNATRYPNSAENWDSNDDLAKLLASAKPDCDI